MTLGSLFEKQVFIRLAEDGNAFICTAKSPLFSRTRRVAIDDSRRDFAPRAAESGPMAGDDLSAHRQIMHRQILPE